MERRAQAGVLLDTCTACGGTWLDRGELEALALGLHERPRRLEERASAEARAEGRRMVRGGLDCPRCGGELRGEWLSGLDVERCTRCAGLFLDGGELALLLARRRPSAPARLLGRLLLRARRALERARGR